MTNDFEIENDNYQPDEETFYRGYVSPADEWSFKPESLFTELNGSIFEAKNSVGRRLARLNQIIAFAESKDNIQYNKKTRIADQYNFLTQFIPENLFTKITEVLAFTSRDKKKIAKDIGLNLDTLANIVSLWQLELHAQSNFIADCTLDELNSFLKESSSFGEMKKRGHLSSKDIERAENRILRQLYSQSISSESNSDNKKVQIPKRVLNYYQEFMQTGMHDHLFNKHKKLLEKQPTRMIPFHVYLLLQKIAILKKILPKIALDYCKLAISDDELVQLGEILDRYYQDKKAMAGELIVQGIVLLEAYYNIEARIKEDAPLKFQQRLRKYRLDPNIKQEFIELAEKVRSDHTSKKTLLDTPKESTIVTEIEKQIRTLTDFTTGEPILPKLAAAKKQDVIEDYSVSNNKEQIYKKLLPYHFITKTLNIPDQVFNEIVETINAYNIPLGSKRKTVKGLSLITLISIVSLWRLLLMADNQYVSDDELEKLNNYLLKKGYIDYTWEKITLKKLDLAESEILRNMYATIQNKNLGDSSNLNYSMQYI